MTSKNDPPSKPPADPPKPADPLAGQPIEVLIDALARFAGSMKGLEGEELRRFVLATAVQMQSTVSSIEKNFATEATRKEAAAEAQQLVDQLVRTGTAAGKALEEHRAPITNALGQANLQQLAAGMRALTDWMANPNAKSEAEAKALMEKLQETMGPLVGYDPSADQARRKQEIKEHVQRRLDGVQANLKAKLDAKKKKPDGE